VRFGANRIVDFLGGLLVCNVFNDLSGLANNTTTSNKVVELLLEVEVTLLLAFAESSSVVGYEYEDDDWRVKRGRTYATSLGS
jgi:hypothetical protein